MNKRPYQICNRCVMDTSDEDIIFDEKGICNHCKDFEEVLKIPRFDKKNAAENLKVMIAQIKERGKGRKYDCVMGISGGVDSCYAVYLAHSWGLRPLVMHMDNGWNSEIAVQNIKNLVNKLKIDYVSYVLDWNEFREIQLAFLKSSIVDLEMPTDLAIPATCFITASKNDVASIISGGNYSSEGILPLTWGYHVKKDIKLYKHIVRKYGKVRNKKVPYIGLWQEFYFKFIKRIKTFYPLNLVEYDKNKAREFLAEEFGWKDYGGKHHESKITGFWQGYVMPSKYNMDYRRATYASQIVNKQITREEALLMLKEKSFDLEKVEQDKSFIAKKFGISVEELNKILSEPPKTYKDFPNQKKIIDFVHKTYRMIFN
ncbi:MAG: N-acetyl sugar amidotransferase [Flavobacteriales bacterium]|nr:N-acetyl sugar amidotransferase [Flavobacteriales bacterium]